MMTKILSIFLLNLSCYAVEISDFQLFNKIDHSLINDTLPETLHMRVQSLAPVIINVSQTLKLNPSLALSITWTESHFKAQAVSKKKAQGLMQILPKTQKEVMKKLGYEYNKMFTQNLNSNIQYQELENIIIGTSYLTYLLERFNNNVDHAIIAYNMGPTWLSKQLKNNKIVGNRNDYLNKVKNKMRILALN